MASSRTIAAATLLLAASIFTKTSAAQDLPAQFAAGLATPAGVAKISIGIAIEQAAVAIPEWGTGRRGLERRAGWLTAGYLARYTGEFAAARLTGHDTSYQRCACKGFPRRAAHALRSEFVERAPGGGERFASARLFGLSFSAAVTAPMLPLRYGPADVGRRAVAAIAMDEGLNVLVEFWPEIKRTLLFRKQ